MKKIFILVFVILKFSEFPAPPFENPAYATGHTQHYIRIIFVTNGTIVAIIKTILKTSSDTIKTLLERRYDARLCLLFKNMYIIADREIKMLEVESLFMLVKAVLYEHGPQNWQRPIFYYF